MKKTKNQMTVEEAVMILAERKNVLEYVTDNDDEAFDMGINALSKESPMPMKMGIDNGRPRKCCGNCECFVLPISEYCSRCGQKIDWDSVIED